MISHVVLFRFHREVPDEEIVLLMQEMSAMKEHIINIVEIHCGENFAPDSDGYTHALVVILNDKKDLEAYRLHPAHQPIVKKVERMAEKIIRLDYEFQPA